MLSSSLFSTPRQHPTSPFHPAHASAADHDREVRAGSQHAALTRYLNKHCTAHPRPTKTAQPTPSPHPRKGLAAAVQGCRSREGPPAMHSLCRDGVGKSLPPKLVAVAFNCAQEAPDPARQSQGSSPVCIQQAQVRKRGFAAASLSRRLLWLPHTPTVAWMRRHTTQAPVQCSSHMQPAAPPLLCTSTMPEDQDACHSPRQSDRQSLCSCCCSTAARQRVRARALCVDRQGKASPAAAAAAVSVHVYVWCVCPSLTA